MCTYVIMCVYYVYTGRTVRRLAVSNLPPPLPRVVGSRLGRANYVYVLCIYIYIYLYLSIFIYIYIYIYIQVYIYIYIHIL